MFRDRSLLFASLARLTEAGIPVLQAGRILESRVRDAASRQVVQALETGLAGGKSIAGALRPALTDLEYRMVEAAGSGGRLSAGFAHLERYCALLAASRATMWRAALYPLSLLHAAALTAGVTARLAGRPAVPAAAGSLLAVWVVLLLLYGAGRALFRRAGSVEPVDRFIRAVPLVSGCWSNLVLSRWSAVLHFYLVSARNMAAALEAAGGACGSACAAAASRRMAAAAAAGGDAGEAMAVEPVFPEDFAAGFLTAGLTGHLDTEMEAQMHRRMEAVASAMGRLAVGIPKLLYAAALAYAVWQVFAIISGIGGQYQRAMQGAF